MAVITGSYVLDAAIVILGVLLAAYAYVTCNLNYWSSQGIPSVRFGIWTALFHRFLLTKHIMFFDQMVYKQLSKKGAAFGGFYELRTPVLMILDPDLLRSIYVKDFDHFVDRRPFETNKQDAMLAKMLFSLTGTEWKHLRVKMSPTFTSGKMKRTFEAMNECTVQMERYVGDLASTGEAVEMINCFNRYTMDIIGSTAFGVKCDTYSDQESPFIKAAKEFQMFTFTKMIRFLMTQCFPRMAKFLKIVVFPNEGMSVFTEVVKSSMKHRRDTGQGRNDFLQLMMEAKTGDLEEDHPDDRQDDSFEREAQISDVDQSATKHIITDDVIVANCVIFFLAGSDSSAGLVSFAMYELALNPELQERAYEEIVRCIEQHDGEVSYDSLRDMEYIDMIINETLRRYPLAPRLERLCTKDYIIPGTSVTIKKGTTIVIPAASFHLDEKYYPEPSRFDPERFSPEEKRKRNPYVYTPFGHGPRNCIGMRFALLQSKVALVGMLRRFMVSPCDKTEIPIKYSPRRQLLGPQNGIWLTVKRR